jgi:hypothetical protein
MAGYDTSIHKIRLYKSGYNARDFSTSPDVRIAILRIPPVHVHVTVVIAIHVRNIAVRIPGALFYFRPSVSPEIFFKTS